MSDTGKERQKLIDEKVADKPRIEPESKMVPTAPKISSVDTLERFDYVEPKNEKWPVYSTKKLHKHQRKEECESSGTSLDYTSLSTQSSDLSTGTPFSKNAFTPGSANYDPHQSLFVPSSSNPNIPFTSSVDYCFNPAAPPPSFHGQALVAHPQTPVHHGLPPVTPHHSHFSDSFGTASATAAPAHSLSSGPSTLPFDIQSGFHIDISGNLPQSGPPSVMFDYSGNNIQGLNTGGDERSWRRGNKLDMEISSSVSTPNAGPSLLPAKSILTLSKAKPPPLDIPAEIPAEKPLGFADTPDADNDDEPRFMSLESRIQSLLQGGSEADDKDDGKSGGDGGSESDVPPSPAPLGALKPPPHSQDIGCWNSNSVHLPPTPDGHLPHILPPHIHMPLTHHTPPPFVQSLPSGHVESPSHQNTDMWPANGITSNNPWTPPSNMDGCLSLQSFESPKSQNGADMSKGRGKNHKRHSGRGVAKFGSLKPVFLPPETVSHPFGSEGKRDNRKRGDKITDSKNADASQASPLDFQLKPYLEESIYADKNEQIDNKDMEDDRMSLDSVSSGDERLEVNPSDGQQQTFNGVWLNHQSGFDHFGMLISEYDSETDYVTQMFTHVLNDFVKELKSIMQRDLCKKMVETSAFKYFENWWDQEEEKHKVL